MWDRLLTPNSLDRYGIREDGPLFAESPDRAERAKLTPAMLTIVQAFAGGRTPRHALDDLLAMGLEIDEQEFEAAVGTLINRRLLEDRVVTIEKYTAYSEPVFEDFEKTTTTFVTFHKPDEEVRIGKYCSIAPNVVFNLHARHDYRLVSTFPFRRRFLNDIDPTYGQGRRQIVIKNDVWIGHSASIMSGVTIGNGAVVGANSHIVTNVPDYAVVVGNPAEVMTYRFTPEVIARLLAISWWDWPDEKVRDNIDMFYGDVNEFIRVHGDQSETSAPAPAIPATVPEQDGLEAQLLAFIRNEILVGQETSDIVPTTPILTTGRLSSFGLINLLSFVEETTGVLLTDAEVLSQRIDTVQAIAAAVKHKQE